MIWFKRFLWLVLGSTVSLILILHLASYAMSYDTSDILELIPTAHIESQIILDRSVRTVFQDNSSDTLLIFIHGAPGSFDGFKEFLTDKELQRYNLLAYDRPGYGSSGQSPMPSIVDQSNTLLNIIKSHPTDKIILIGHSYGAAIAGYTGAANSDIIDKVVMIAPLLDPKKEPIFWFSWFGKWPATRLLLTNDLKTCGIEKFEHSEALSDIETSWSNVKIPIMHIHGVEDGIAPEVYNTSFSTKYIDFTYLTLKVLEHEGHFILWEEYELTKQLILDFIRE